MCLRLRRVRACRPLTLCCASSTQAASGGGQIDSAIGEARSSICSVRLVPCACAGLGKVGEEGLLLLPTGTLLSSAYRAALTEND